MIEAVLDWSGQKWSLSVDSFNQDLNDKKSSLQIPVFMTELLVLPGQAFWTEANFLKKG